MTIETALGRLREAADDGVLADLCTRHRLDLVTVFGSATREASTAGDLDVAVLCERDVVPDALGVVNDLVDLTGTDDVDLLVLDDATSEGRFAALVGALPLYEREPGLWATQQMAAAGALCDTAWLRRLELRRMAEL